MLFQSWSDLWRLAVVGVLVYPFLIVVLRLSGKRTLAKMNAFDLVVTVALGSTLASILLSRDISVVEGVGALTLLVGLQLAATWLSARFRSVSRVLKSEPTLLVSDGRLLTGAMLAQRVTDGEIRQAVRSRGIGALDRVAAVVLETDGTFSVVPTNQAGDLTALCDVRGAATPGSGAPTS